MSFGTLMSARAFRLGGRKLAGGWFLLVLPLLALLAGIQLREARGPHWLSENLDPSYPYLLNSLNVANLHRPYHVEHPGTPVQSAGALVIRLSHPLSGEQATARAVLTDPERYLRRLSTLFVVFYALALLAGGFAALAATRSAALALLYQATPFVSGTSVEALTGVRPEPLVAACAVLLGALAVLCLRYEVGRYRRRYALAFGAVVGFGVACKVTFAPLAALPLLLLPRWRARAEFCAATLVSFLFFIAPMFGLHQFRLAFGFLGRVLTHTGRYGSGEPGFADPRRFVESAARLAAGEWLFYTLLFTGLLLAAWALVGRRRVGRRAAPSGTQAHADDARSSKDDARALPQDAGAARRAAPKIMLAAAGAELLQLLLVAKHPEGKYLVASLGLAGLNLVLLFELLGPRRAARYALAAALVLAAFVQAHRLNAQREHFTRLAREQLATHELSEREARVARVARYYSASSPAYALKFGLFWSNHFYGPLLEELYPGQLFWDPWTGRFSDFRNRLADARARALLGESFVLHGYSLFDSDFRKDLPPDPLRGLSVEDLHRGSLDRPRQLDGEALYRARFNPAR